MEGIAVPVELQRLSGRILDVDSHEMMPPQEWVPQFGREFRDVANAYIAANDDFGGMSDPDFPGDIMPVGPDIASLKGPRAPGAVDPKRRLEAMDALGISSQLMFPSGVGILGFLLTIGKKLPFPFAMEGDLRSHGMRWLDLYGEWALDIARLSDRIRPVLPLYGDTPEDLYARAERYIKAGAPAFWIASGVLPGGCSPASAVLDRLWSLMAESNTVITLHGGGEGQFLRTNEWRNAAAFEGYRTTSEFEFDPWSMSIYHLPSQNFVTTMVFGGVFERHPALRFGVIEVGCQWVGPMMENIDLLYDKFRMPSAPRLPRKPSDYVRSNVRVSPLVYEDIDVWIERHAGLEDVVCFSTDYPHPEGGRSAAKRFHNKVARLGESIVEKFFVTNGSLLLP